MKRYVDNLLDKFHSVEISQSCRTDNTHISPDLCFPFHKHNARKEEHRANRRYLSFRKILDENLNPHS